MCQFTPAIKKSPRHGKALTSIFTTNDWTRLFFVNREKTIPFIFVKGNFFLLWGSISPNLKFLNYLPCNYLMCNVILSGIKLKKKMCLSKHTKNKFRIFPKFGSYNTDTLLPRKYALRLKVNLMRF